MVLHHAGQKDIYALEADHKETKRGHSTVKLTFLLPSV